MIEKFILEAVEGMGVKLDFAGVEIPKREGQGDISTPVAMSLSGKLKTAPRKIAEALILALNSRPEINAMFEKIEILGPGFINFHLKADFIYDRLMSLYNDSKEFLRVELGFGKRVQVEFVSANPTGPLHLGHGRGAALGAALANLLTGAGYEVEKEFYINDAGRQVSLLGQSVFGAYHKLCNSDKYPIPEDGYRGDYIEVIAKDIAETHGNSLINRNFSEVSTIFIDYSYKKMLKWIDDDLSTFNVTFDRWQSERELFDSGIVGASIDLLRQQGYIYDEDGAVWFRATAFGDEKDRVIIKSDGTYTYFASDISYHIRKFQRGFDECINIWGADHHGYIPRVKAAIKAAGVDDSRLTVLLVQMVSLLRAGVPVQMSKRAGEFITLKDLIDEIGADTARFIFLTRRPDSQLEFDLDAAKAQSAENPVFYVQYAFARINSIFSKAHERGIQTTSAEINLSLLDKPEELQIIKKLILYPLIYENAARAREPHRITFYLQELSGMFHPYYNKYRILSVEGSEESTESLTLTHARLILCESIKTIIEAGLKTLGITAPERM
ncbi:arginine--tRNA ligase [Candidatus Magnetomonas plexicatena]|uniref:arginine--tRNA ligase n=1 Tax=Candidatus Magnetomonas plexicatena TaxID=2552947 RepID=UPI001C747F3E|nr:arginine--tRNA ligase [Nitrospirales bacterium LBB_01]